MSTNLFGSLYHLLHVYVVVDVCEVCNDTFVLYQQWQAIMQCSAANAATAEFLSQQASHWVVSIA